MRWPVLILGFCFDLFFCPAVSQHGHGCLSSWGVTPNTWFLIFAQVPLLSAVLRQILLKALSWSFRVSSAGFQMGPVLRFSVHKLTSKSEHSLLTDHFYYSSDSLFILNIIHHRYKTTEGWSHLLKYLDIIQDASFKCFFVLRELKNSVPLSVPCQVLVLLGPGDFITSFL